MTLCEAIEQYIVWRQAHGAQFTTGADILRRFLGYANGDAACDEVTTAQVLAFLVGKGPLTRNRENKYYALAGFWRHAISRGHAARSPLPDNEPRSPVRAPPYIYSPDELQRLFEPANVEISRWGAVQLDEVTFRTLLLVLYGAGLRFSEATRLALADVDLAESVLTIRATKFYKSRLTPVGPQLAEVLKAYMPWRLRRNLERGQDSYLLANRDGTRLTSSTVQAAFDALRRIAGIHGAAGGRQFPRLHDLRHNSGRRIIPATAAQGLHFLENRALVGA
jgi:integrase